MARKLGELGKRLARSRGWLVNQKTDRQVVLLANASVDDFQYTLKDAINTALCGAH